MPFNSDLLHFLLEINQTNGARVFDLLPHFYSQYILALGIVALVIVALVRQRIKGSLAPSVFALSLVGSLFFPQLGLPSHSLFGTETYSYFFQCFSIVSGIFTCFLIERSEWSRSEMKSEMYGLLLFSILGMSLLAVSTNLFSLFLCLECVSIPAYCLTAFGFSSKSSEAAAKYVIYGSASSAIMLFGISILYGIWGTLELEQIKSLSPSFSTSPLVTLALAFVLVGLFFKIATFPFQAWAPDVYEGAPTPLVAFFSIAPKAIAFAVLIHMVPILEGGMVKSLLVVISIASMTIGNLLALGQTNAKRLLAYSSVSHSGFLLMSIAAGSDFGFDSVIYYLCIYVAMNFSAFHLLQIITKWKGSEELESFSGLGKSNPYLATSLLITMISLTGLPPSAGFSAKLFMFSGVYESYHQTRDVSMLVMLAAALLNTVLSLFYYLKMPFYAFFRGNGENASLILSKRDKAFILTLNALLLLFFFKPDWVFVIIKLTKLQS